MNRWLLIGVVVAAALFSFWKWGGAAALPYLGVLACPLMGAIMGLMCFNNAKSARKDQRPEGADRNTGT